MTQKCRRWVSYAWMLSAVCLVLATTNRTVQAGDVSEEQIINSLAQPRSRSLSSPSQHRVDRNFIKRLRHRTTRSLTVEDRGRIATIAKRSPKIDLQIQFDFNSAAITPGAEPQLEKLGRALTGPELNGTMILVSGHTDATGSVSYNQDLSERRAAAVRHYLVEKFHIPGENLTAVGYGENNLANKDNPYAAENRRVEIANLASKQQAGR